jgi:cell wall-associated NlpC family hydrolase
VNVIIPPPPSSARSRAVEWALGRIGDIVLMGYRGELRFDRQTRALIPHGHGFDVWDCSGFCTAAMRAGGAADLTGTHNAQLLHDGSRELEPTEGPLPGDLVFYGSGPEKVVHVAMWLAGGSCISADGATWGITSLGQARAARCEVRLHKTIHYRLDCAYVRVRRNVWLDAVDRVSR